MRSIRNLLLISFFASSFAQAVNILWIEYDHTTQQIKAGIEYEGLEDQEFSLSIEPSGEQLFGQIIAVEDDESGEKPDDEAMQAPVNGKKKHRKKWERKRINREKEFEKREDSKKEKFLKKERENYRIHSREIALPFDSSIPVLFYVEANDELTLVEIVAEAIADTNTTQPQPTLLNAALGLGIDLASQ